MLNSNGIRELAYVVKIDNIEPIVGSDNCVAATVNGWKVMVRKNVYSVGSCAVYFEIDSLLPEKDERFKFLESKHYKVKTQKYTFGGKGNFISQGLLMSAKELNGYEVFTSRNGGESYLRIGDKTYKVGDFLTNDLGVVYSSAEDNARKGSAPDKYSVMMQRRKKLFSHKFFKWVMKYKFGKKVMFFFFGKKKDKKTGWPVGKFPGVSKTDQERCENMPWVLNDKTPFIVTQKCDGSSGTYILERKRTLFGTKYEFYVCSRNVRMYDEGQECFYGKHNYYWEVANKYHIYDKMKDYLKKNKNATFVCWQGEVCAPGIQSNPHRLSETHFYCFHWTDSVNGRLDIRKANELWREYFMEVVPIVNDNYIMPDDFEEFKKTADGYYDSEVCEGYRDCKREGFVYYSANDPTFSFKNVSREYLLKQK